MTNNDNHTNLMSIGVDVSGCSHGEMHGELQADSFGTSPSVDELWRQDIDL